MTSSGETPSGADDGVNEPDWIDQILARAGDSVGDGSTGSAAQATQDPGSPITDDLAEIKWVDEEPQVTPASTPIVTPRPDLSAQRAPEATRSATALTAENVGRSAWDGELASVGDEEPAGWEKLSWQDLESGDETRTSTYAEPTGFGRMVREWGPVLFAAVAIALFVRLVLVQAYHIPSGSMIPTLENGDRVVVNRLSYRTGEVQRGQVVVFAKPPGASGENDLIKRVIGLPGETIRFADNQVFINDLLVTEPYLAPPGTTSPRSSETPIPGCAQETPAVDLCLIPEGHVFVMGDNRGASSDSRVFGPVDADTIVGRAFLRVWPLNNMGAL